MTKELPNDASIELAVIGSIIIYPEKYNDVSIPPVQIRFDECIGCQMCAKACDTLTWNAIRMMPTKVFEERYEIEIT